MPGGLLGGLFSFLLGTRLPGRGTNWLKQRLVYPGARASPARKSPQRVEIVRLRPEKDLVNLRGACVADGRVVCEGESLVLVKDLEQCLRSPPTAAASTTSWTARTDADVLVLSNGILMSTASWGYQVPAFAKRHRVLRYDCRGQWQSEHTGGPVQHGTARGRPRGFARCAGRRPGAHRRHFVRRRDQHDLRIPASRPHRGA